MQPREDEKVPKKPYHRPELRVYGNVRDITQNFGSGSIHDHVGGGGRKSH